MDGVSGVSGGAAPRVPTIMNGSACGQNVQAAAGTSSQSMVSGSSSISTSSSMMSSVSLSSRVSSFISTVGAVMTDDQLLRALVLMLLAEAMQKDDEDSKQPLLLGLAALSGGAAGYSSISSFTSMETATNLSQASHQSMSLNTSQAVQSLQGGGGGQGHSPQIDVMG